MIQALKVLFVTMILFTLCTVSLTYYLDPSPRECEMGTVHYEADDDSAAKVEEQWKCHGGKGGILWTSLVFSLVGAGVMLVSYEQEKNFRISETEANTEFLKVSGRR